MVAGVAGEAGSSEAERTAVMTVYVLKEMGYYDSEPRVVAVVSDLALAQRWEAYSREHSFDDFELDNVREIAYAFKAR